jgi:hypothetical protein
VASRLTTTERRHGPRIVPQVRGWHRQALLRPGHEVEVLNLSAGGALLQSTARLKPGMTTELQLQGNSRCTVRGRIARARVISVTPLYYEAALVFDALMNHVMGSG